MHPRARILLRKRIVETLTDAVASYPLVVLTAPMGYGKSTAMHDLIQFLDTWRLFFITLPPGAHNALYLWDIICAQLAAQGSEIAPLMQRMGFPTDPILVQRTLNYGRTYLASRPTVLVIDDYHFANAPEMNVLLEALARERMPGLCVVLLTRIRPDFHLEDLRLKGLAAFFEQDLLTFSRQDAADYFKLHEVEDARAVETAWVFSEGWASALWLSLQSYLTHGVIRPVRDMEILLSEAVFSTYSAEDKRLLLQLSVLDSFTSSQAAVVSGDAAAPRRLRHLHNQNAFLTYDNVSDSYRLHSIFRTFLANRLAEDPSSPAEGGAQNEDMRRRAEDNGAVYRLDKPALYRRAGELFAQGEDRLQAMRFFFQAGRNEDLLRILEVFSIPSDGMFVKFDPEGVASMIRSIPWPVRRQCPIGYLAFIYHYMSRIDLKKGLALLEEVEARCATDNSFTLEERRRIEGEIELIRALEDFNDLSRMRNRHEKAHSLLQGRSSISHPQLVWTFGSPHVAFLYLREPGNYKAMVDLVENNLHYYQEMSGGCSAGAQDLFRGEYSLETGAFHKVEHYLAKAAYRAAAKEQLSSLIAVNFARARYLFAEGKSHKTEEVLEEIRPGIAQAGRPLLMNSLELFQAYIAALRGDEEAIPLWLRRGDMASSPLFYQGTTFAHIVHGKALLVARDWDRLEALAEDIPAKLGVYRNLFARIHALVMHSIAQFNLRGQTQALPLLGKAINLARPDAIVCSIAEYGSHVYPMLLCLRDYTPDDLFLNVLIKTTKRYVRLGGAGQPILAPREQAILERVIQGLNNRDIGAALGITAASVGNTLSRVYTKLGVKNRTEALKKWQESK